MTTKESLPDYATLEALMRRAHRERSMVIGNFLARLASLPWQCVRRAVRALSVSPATQVHGEVAPRG